MRGKAKFGVEVKIQKQLPAGSYLWEVAQMQFGDTRERPRLYVMCACEVLEATDPSLVGMLHYTFFSLKTKKASADTRERFVEMGATEDQLSPGQGPEALVGLVFRADLVSVCHKDGWDYYHLENIVAEEASD